MSPVTGIHVGAGPQAMADMSLHQRAPSVTRISPNELDQVRQGAATSPATSAPGAFSSLLGGLVQEVNAKQAAAGSAVNGLLAGDQVSLHQAMIAVEEASISFQLMVEVRNRLLESYQEIMRMQV